VSKNKPLEGFPLLKFILGQPLSSDRMHQEKLQKLKALPVFASDALSSVAYATEEILMVLVLAGTMALDWVMGIAICIVGLIFIVAISYRQTIMAYPNGAGSYIVSRENLGVMPSKVAGAALLIDYILTVSVSIAAGVAAITSALPILLPHKVGICMILILLITLANLRGAKESANLFALPTYFFIFSLFLLVGGGLFQSIFNPMQYIPPAPIREVLQPLSILLLLKAFAAGCTALTGIEAISDGVTAFKEPTSKNASITLLWMAVILGASFIGITFLAKIYHVVPSHTETVLSQLGRIVFGNSIFYYFIQAATAMILILAANTSYADFPRLCSFIAKDGFLPRQLAQMGDRLVFSNGILVLGVLSAFLIWVFQASVHFLVPLYAVGVFLSFSLSQTSMVRHWWNQRLQDKHWWKSFALNGFGAAVCTFVLIVIAAAKFSHGAWIVLVLIPLIVLMFYTIHRHYAAVKIQLSLKHYKPHELPRGETYVLISNLHRPTIGALLYAKAAATSITGLHVDMDSEETKKLKQEWDKYGLGLPLKILPSPFRSVMGPVLDFIWEVRSQPNPPVVTVVIPEFIPARRWHLFLHNQSAYRLNWELRKIPGVVVSHFRYRLRL
jgi:amino acid transporter